MWFFLVLPYFPPGNMSAQMHCQLRWQQSRKRVVSSLNCLLLVGALSGSLCGSSLVSVSPLNPMASEMYSHPCSAAYIFLPCRCLWNCPAMTMSGREDPCGSSSSVSMMFSSYWLNLAFRNVKPNFFFFLAVGQISIWSVIGSLVFLVVCSRSR